MMYMKEHQSNNSWQCLHCMYSVVQLSMYTDRTYSEMPCQGQHIPLCGILVCVELQIISKTYQGKQDPVVALQNDKLNISFLISFQIEQW